jgi:hypothetical protein
MTAATWHRLAPTDERHGATRNLFPATWQRGPLPWNPDTVARWRTSKARFRKLETGDLRNKPGIGSEAIVLR